MKRAGSIAERRRALQSEIAQGRAAMAARQRKLRDEAGLALLAGAATRLLGRRWRWAGVLVPVAFAVIRALRARRDG
jgi:hypothetical protein